MHAEFYMQLPHTQFPPLNRRAHPRMGVHVDTGWQDVKHRVAHLALVSDRKSREKAFPDLT